MSPKEVDEKFDHWWSEDEIGIELDVKKRLTESSNLILNQLQGKLPSTKYHAGHPGLLRTSNSELATETRSIEDKWYEYTMVSAERSLKE